MTTLLSRKWPYPEYLCGTKLVGLQTVVLLERMVDPMLLALSCLRAKEAGTHLYVLYAIEVPRHLPANAQLTQQHREAERILAEVLLIVHKMDCPLIADILQARHVGKAIVDLLTGFHSPLAVIAASVRQAGGLGTIVPYVLEHARCQVWLDRLAQSSSEVAGSEIGDESFSRWDIS